MVLNPLFNIDAHFKKKVISNIPIDIYIPASIKDVIALRQVIENALTHINHPINKLYIVGKRCIEFEKICNEFNATFLNETEVLGYDKDRINYWVNGEDRSGWLYQQLLKLNADRVVEMEYFLVLDADTILLKQKIFYYRGRMIFDFSQERHEPYHVVYEKILKRKTTSRLSFISHYMLFNKELLQRLKLEIELIHGKNWDDAILENVDYTNTSGFSEYELYGNFLLEKCPYKIKMEYWFNSISQSNSYPNYIKSVSFHSHIKKTT